MRCTCNRRPHGHCCVREVHGDNLGTSLWTSCAQCCGQRSRRRDGVWRKRDGVAATPWRALSWAWWGALPVHSVPSRAPHPQPLPTARKSSRGEGSRSVSVVGNLGSALRASRSRAAARIDSFSRRSLYPARFGGRPRVPAEASLQGRYAREPRDPIFRSRPRVPWRRSSSVGQSSGIIIRVSGVQIPPPLPTFSRA